MLKLGTRKNKKTLTALEWRQGHSNCLKVLLLLLGVTVPEQVFYLIAVFDVIDYPLLRHLSHWILLLLLEP